MSDITVNYETLVFEPTENVVLGYSINLEKERIEIKFFADDVESPDFFPLSKDLFEDDVNNGIFSLNLPLIPSKDSCIITLAFSLFSSVKGTFIL